MAFMYLLAKQGYCHKHLARVVILIAGGTEEAQTAYSEAYNAIFDLQLEYHSHMQPYLSATDGTPRYAQIELWPMIVSSCC